MDKNVTMFGAAGAGIGALQTPLVREYIDKKHAAPFPSLKGFGTYSALAGIGVGGLALAGGIYGMTSRKLSDKTVEFLIDYGTVALVSGVLSGALPVSPAVATAGMPVIRYAGEREAILKMSTELQRLSTENAGLRAQARGGETIPIQPVRLRQQQYGFMDPSRTPVPNIQQPAPGKAMPAARQYGFMDQRGPLVPSLQQPAPGRVTPAARNFGFMDDGSLSIAKTQAMKAYGFLG